MADKLYNRYTERDISAIRKTAIDSVKNSHSKWNDFNESDLGMVLIEAAAGIVDMGNYYLDNQALESNLMTARQPKNIKGIIEGYNIKLKSLGSAIGTVDIHPKDSVHAVVPAYTQLRSSSGIYYITTKSKVIEPESNIAIDIPVMQGARYIERVKSSLLKECNYKYYIKTKNVPIDSVKLYQDNQKWTKVEDAFLEIKGGSKYSVHEDKDGNVYLLFTFDWKDYLPRDSDETIEVYYVESIGTKGVVPPMSITSIEDIIEDVNGTQVNDKLRISNANSTYGAYDRINYSKLKSIARNNILTMGRCITLADYDAKIKLEPYVLDAYTCDWRSDSTRIKRPYQVKSWILTTDSFITDPDNLPEFTKLEKELMDIGDVAVQVIVNPAIANEIRVKVDLVSRGLPQIKSEIRSKVIQFLKDRFSLYELSLGDTLDPADLKSDIFKLSSSILSMEIEVEGNLKCEDNEFFRLTGYEVSQLDTDEIDYGLLDGDPIEF